MIKFTFSFSLSLTKVRVSDILAWVWGQKKMSQVLGMFWLLDSTMLLPVTVTAHFENYEPLISLVFQFFGGQQ
jgi:membrane protein CcdC involved in cytochrome C biogenesis